MDTSASYLEDGGGGSLHQSTRPDLSIYFDTNRTRNELRLFDGQKPKLAKAQNDPQTQNHADTAARFISKTSYADIVVVLEVKKSQDGAAFTVLQANKDPSDRITRDNTELGRKALAQITEYCSAILGRQHRTHLFAAYVCHNQARLLFVDREGCHISKQLTYVGHANQTLHCFFWRLAHMNHQQLGFDSSVTLADGEEKKLFKHAQGMKTADPQRALILRALCRDPKTETYESVSTQWPLQRMTVGSETYVVGRPIIQTSALHGPAPRLFHAFHVEQDGSIKGYTIKDYWRPDHEEIELEHKVYDRLKEAKVTNIPTCVYGGDVEVNGKVQRTKDEGLVHYRIVLEGLLQPLLEFENFHELSAMNRLVRQAKTLHRQIGTNSILILSEFDDATQQITRTALLGDWELSKTKTLMDNATGPRQRAVVGPWYFRSSLSLQFPLLRPYRLSDEVEAFVHVFQYLVLRFHVTQYTADEKESYKRLQDIVKMVYADFKIGKNNLSYTGGDEKFIRMGYPKPWLDPMNNQTLYDILLSIATVSSKHYSTIDGREYNNRYGRGGAPPNQPVATPDDVALLNEDGPLSTHKGLKEIFGKYADHENWRKSEKVQPDGKTVTVSDDAKGPDFFRAAGIIPMDENGFVIDPKRPAGAESGGSEPANKKQRTA
ncbi:uncharacterized protein BXZ73DRAFT_56444 [Epithele typhae]|uniref:uncharacterized protein n=1 Tax=Epithele typhae TaxID=378194 RepID=UPI0020089FB4|nr:uncharacterized protein BXZ73DRAFT_56444 [Epithele typhae]KAH9912206.1 hypothetical protein BXZ73DRAFT_56444 [Epithele typhae]